MQWFFLRNAQFADVTYSDLYNTIRYFAMGASPLSLDVRLLSFLMLRLFAENLVTTVSLTTPTQVFSASENVFEQSRLFFVMFFFCFALHVRGKKRLHALAGNESLQSLLRNSSHFCFSSKRSQSGKSLSASAKYSDLVSSSISPYLSVSQNYQKRLYWSSNNLIVVDCKINRTAINAFLQFGFTFEQQDFINLIVDMPQSLETFLTMAACVFQSFLYVKCKWRLWSKNW